MAMDKTDLMTLIYGWQAGKLQRQREKNYLNCWQMSSSLMLTCIKTLFEFKANYMLFLMQFAKANIRFASTN